MRIMCMNKVEFFLISLTNSITHQLNQSLTHSPMYNIDKCEPWDNKYTNTTPLHVALLENKRKAVLFLIAFGADINVCFDSDLSYYGDQHTVYTALTYVSECRKDLLSIVNGGVDNARDILISEGLLNEEERVVKPSKH